jgi:hypothetical protein
VIEALDEPVMATIDGEQREITKREAVVTQPVNKSAAAGTESDCYIDDPGSGGSVSDL